MKEVKAAWQQPHLEWGSSSRSISTAAHRVIADLDDHDFEVISFVPEFCLHTRHTILSGLLFTHIVGSGYEIRKRPKCIKTHSSSILLPARGSFRLNNTTFGLGSYAILPAGKEISLSPEDEKNDLVIISNSNQKIFSEPSTNHDENFLLVNVPRRDAISFASIATALSSSLSQSHHSDHPLQIVAESLMTSMLKIATGSYQPENDLLSQAMNILEIEYPNFRLDIKIVANQIGVSVRTLQSAFSTANTTFGKSLRTIRVNAAQQFRMLHPNASTSEILLRSGFGSESSMYRAMKIHV